MRLFNLIEPTCEDTDWNLLVSDAQKDGRDISLDESPPIAVTRDEQIAEIRKRLNCEYTEVLLL